MKILTSLLLASSLFLPAWAEGDHDTPQKQHWSFEGPLGKFDRSALQRGFQVYKEVCATCHSLKRVSIRSLSALGYKENELKAIALNYEMPGDLDDEGKPTTRKGLPSDYFHGPYANDKAARAANNGALPPDLSLITKARVGGANYIHALLTGYKDAPADMKLGDNQYYNPYMSGRAIAMIPPLKEGLVTFADGTKATVDQMARDVATFLSWAAEPELEERKQLGFKVMLYLAVLTALLYLAKRKIWAELKS